VNADPVVVAGVLLVIAASAYHAVTEHHVHLRVARLVNPAVVVPETRHDTRWHAMTHRQRWYVNGGMIVMAIALGLAWRVQPRVTTISVVIVFIAAAAALIARAVSRAIGSRHRAGPDTDQED
jgi:hypothetical protein